MKRPTIDTTTSSPSPSSTTPSTANSNPPSQPHMDNIVTSTLTSNHMINPLFYGLPSNTCDVMSLQFPRLSSGGYNNLQPQMNNALGLGFSSGVMSSDHATDNGYRNGFISSNNTLFSTYSSIFGSSSTTTPSTPVMASLLLQQKFMNNSGMKDGPSSNNFQGLVPVEEMHMEGNSCERGVNMGSKEVKVEGQNRLDQWNNNNGGSCQNLMEHMGLLNDPSLYWNTATTMGAWSDQPNINPSVSSLI